MTQNETILWHRGLPDDEENTPRPIPIAERLTEEETAAARAAYAKYHPIEESYYAAGKAVCETLRSIFGADFFEEGKEAER